MARKNVTFFLDAPKYGSGDDLVSREVAATPLPVYMNMQGPDYSMQNMSLCDDYYYADGGSCDPPGELNTYESEFSSYPYEIASIPVQRRRTNASRRPQCYASVYSQSASGVPCGEADFGRSRTQYSHHNSAKISSRSNRVSSLSDSVSSSPRSGGQSNYSTPFIEPSYRSTHGQGNRRLPSSPHPRRQKQEYHNNSNQFYESVNYQRELLNELILLKREIHDKDADASCSGKFGYFMKTAFCQVENLAARRRRNLRQAIGDVARSKKMLEEELRQQLLDIKKQRQEMEERFKREINKQISEKVAREAQLESMLLDEMEECVKLEIQSSGLDLIEESRMRMLSPTAKESSDSFVLPTAANATAVQSARVASSETDRKNIQQTDRHQVFTKDEGPVANKDLKAPMQNEEDEPKFERQEMISQKESMGPTVSTPGVLKDVAVSEAINSATQKVAMFKLGNTSVRGIEDQCSHRLKQSRLISLSLCHPGTLGLEVEQRQDASLSAAVARVVQNSQADVAGVKKGDILCHADSDKEFSYHEFLRLAKSGIRPLRFNVRRIASSSFEGNDAKSSMDATKKKQDIESLPEAQEARDKVLVGPLHEVAADTDQVNQEDSKFLANPTDYSGGFNNCEKLKDAAVVRKAVVKTTNDLTSGPINPSNKATRKPVIPPRAMPEPRCDTDLKPSLLVFTNDFQLAKGKPKKQDANKENAGCKPCLRVQSSHLNALPSPKLPFSVANLNSPKNSSTHEIHSYSPDASSAKAITFSSEKFTKAQTGRPVSSQMPRIELGAALTVSVNDKKSRIKKANDRKVTPVMATRGVIDVE